MESLTPVIKRDGQWFVASYEEEPSLTGRGLSASQAFRSLEKKHLSKQTSENHAKYPEYDDFEFKRQVRLASDDFKALKHEALRNPSDEKISQLLHTLRVLVDDLASPVKEHQKNEQERFFDPYQDGLLGNCESRKKYNQFFRDFAGRRYTWPCNVEIHKGLGGMTFPRSKENHSGLEQFLQQIGLAANLMGKPTSHNKNAGTSFRDTDGNSTFSGFVLNEIEIIEMRLRAVKKFPPVEERDSSFKFPTWLKAATRLPEISIDSVEQWTDSIIERLYAEECPRLENHWELFPLLEGPFLTNKKDKGGGTFEAYAKARIRKELRKLVT